MPNVDFIDTLAFGIDAEHTRKRCGVKMVQGGEEIIVRYVAHRMAKNSVYSQFCCEYDRAVAPTLLFSVPSPTLPIPLTQLDCCTPLLFDDAASCDSSSSQPTALRIRSRSPNIELSLEKTTYTHTEKDHLNGCMDGQIQYIYWQVKINHMICVSDKKKERQK